MYVTQIMFWVCTVVEAVVVMLFLTASARNKGGKKYLAPLVGFLLYLFLTYTLRGIYDLYIVCLYFLILLYCRFSLEGRAGKHAVVTLVVLAANIISSEAALTYLEILLGTLPDTVDMFISSSIVFFIWKTLNLILLWVSYMIARRTYKGRLKEAVGEIALFFLNLIVSTIFMIWFGKNGVSDDSKYFVDGVLLSVFIFTYVYVLILHYKNNNKAEKEKCMLENYVKVQQKNLIKIQQDYYNDRILKDDNNKMLRVYMKLLKENKIEEVMADIKEQIKDAPPGLCVYVEDNNSINAVINEKNDICVKSGIDLCVQITAQIRKGMETDAAVIIHNLLDNAIEIQKDSGREAKIVMNIFERRGMYNVVVKNNIKNSVLKKSPWLKSGKEDKMYRGIELNSIRDMVDKYGGIIDIEECEEQFIVHVALPI